MFLFIDTLGCFINNGLFSIISPTLKCKELNPLDRKDNLERFPVHFF